MTSNQELLEKAVTTSTFATAGALNAEQQQQFVVLIRRYARLLNLVRFVRLTQQNAEIDKMHIGQPLTSGATENVGPGPYQAPKFNKVVLAAKKVRTDWAVTTEAFQQNIEQNRFEDTLMEAIAERMATDLEMMAIQGDESLSGTDPFETLLKVNDGFDKLTDNAHIVDAGAQTIKKEMFKVAKQVMPKQFRADPGLRFMMNDNLHVDWLDQLATGPGGGNPGASGIGDGALRGVGIAPFGVPVEMIHLIPDDLAVSKGATAKPAFVQGTEGGPFELSAGADVAVTIDGNSPAVDIELTAVDATLDAVQVAATINAALEADGNHGTDYKNVVRVDSEGRLVFVSPTTGATSSVELAEGATSGDSLAALGLTAGATAGAGGSAGALNNGTFMWLANPRNFIWAMLDGTRIFTEFNKDKDVVESVIYNHVDAQIENLDAVVKVSNILTNSMGDSVA